MQNMYTTSGIIQRRLTEAYLQTNKRPNLPEIIMKIYDNGEYVNTKPELPLDSLWSNLTDDEFIKILSLLPIHLNAIIDIDDHSPVQESILFPLGSDVFIFKHFNFINNNYHIHNYFEIGYVFKGNCQLKFEKEQHILNEGELFIIAPMSLHDIIIDDDHSVIILINIRKSTFDSSFFTLLSQQDLLSYFFRTILSQHSSSNYLLFFTNNELDIKTIIKNLAMENYKADIYFNNCCINWVNILFSIILRKYSHTIQFYNYSFLNTHFLLILQYIQQHHKTISLKSLAEFFHYSEAHLCTLIKKNTGLNFTVLINNLKISKAAAYLKNTTLSIADISELVGYNSVDHFYRTFKKYHNKSPQQYRNQLNKQ